MTTLEHAARAGLLMVGAAGLLGWVIRHSEATFADGLRYIRQAERIERGTWRDAVFEGIDHPLYPLGIALAHRITGGAGPASWQRAALFLSFACGVLLIVPVYLLSLELCCERSAALACALVIANPILGYIVANVLSESTFLLWWSFGLWAAVRFLRAGRLLWLPLALGFGALAYLTRPEGMLLPLALGATLLILPLLARTRLNWPRRWRVLAFLLGGLALLVAPYIAIKGGLGTKPGIARVLGLAPWSHPLGLEREKPLPPDQTTFDTYRLAAIRMLKVFRAAVTPPLFPFALLGLVTARSLTTRSRAWLFVKIMLAASAVALVRLHATSGYCTIRHGVIPGVLLTLAAAHGIIWLTTNLALRIARLGASGIWYRAAPAVRGIVIALFLIMIVSVRPLGPFNPGPFSTYHAAGSWLARNTRNDEQVLDLTDWSLYFSKRDGYHFADIHQAPTDRKTRWVVARTAHIEGHWYYSQVLRELIAGRQPVALVPAQAGPNQIQIRIYDRQAAAPQTAMTDNSNEDPTQLR